MCHGYSSSSKRCLRRALKPASTFADWHGRKVVIKVRIPKKYRPEALDKQIRSYRTVHEPQLMHEAKAAGVPTPLIYMVNVPEASITMEFIEGQQIKQLLNQIPQEQAAGTMHYNRRINRQTSQARLNPRRPNNLKHDSKPQKAKSFLLTLG